MLARRSLTSVYQIRTLINCQVASSRLVQPCCNGCPTPSSDRSLVRRVSEIQRFPWRNCSNHSHALPTWRSIEITLATQTTMLCRQNLKSDSQVGFHSWLATQDQS